MDRDSAPAAALRIALVVSRYHDFVTRRLREGARAALASAGCDASRVTEVEVPGAFEIPFAARLLARTGRVDAVVCLGCLVRGETPHFDVIAQSVASGLQTAASESGIPMTFGVLTTNTVEQAVARAGAGPSNKGYEAALAAVEMATLARRIAAAPAPGLKV